MPIAIYFQFQFIFNFNLLFYFQFQFIFNSDKQIIIQTLSFTHMEIPPSPKLTWPLSPCPNSLPHPRLYFCWRFWRQVTQLSSHVYLTPSGARPISTCVGWPSFYCHTWSLRFFVILLQASSAPQRRHFQQCSQCHTPSPPFLTFSQTHIFNL